MKAQRFLFIVVALVTACLQPGRCRVEAAEGDRKSAIPERPEKLTFPPLTYEPPAPTDYRVQLKNGPIVYIAPDRELPLFNLVIYVRTGEYLEPAGKEGLAQMTGSLLARGGTKSKTAEELEERLAFLAAHLVSSVGDTEGSISLNLLSKDIEEGLGILREVLTEPKFQEDRFVLQKQQLLQSMKQRNDDSADIEAREREFLALGENFWNNRHTTEASVKGLSRADLVAFHKKWFHPTNFIVAVSGDFDRDAMVQKLENLFADWPFAGEIPPPIPANTEFAKAGVYLVNKEVNQGRVSILLPGVLRDDPDYFAIMVMNRVLGSGGFTSRIVNRVRSDEGLAYAASSSFPGGVYYPLAFTAAFQSKSRTVAYAVSIILEEMKRMGAEPVSKEELNTAKRSFIETFPRVFSSKAQIAGVFAQDEFTGRHEKEPDFWKKYRGRIEAVTIEDVERVGREHLDLGKAVILAVGERDEILAGHPDHPIGLEALSKSKLIEVPLRDPMTMLPLPK